MSIMIMDDYLANIVKNHHSEMQFFEDNRPKDSYQNHHDISKKRFLIGLFDPMEYSFE